jgi:phage terminase Nu1 subunit (DNA packaging protein)
MQNLIKEINTPQAHNYKQQMMTVPSITNPHLDKMKNEQAKLQDENSRLDQNLGNLLGKFV